MVFRKRRSACLRDVRQGVLDSAEVVWGVAGTNLSAALEAALPDFEAKVTLKPSSLFLLSLELSDTKVYQP